MRRTLVAIALAMPLLAGQLSRRSPHGGRRRVPVRSRPSGGSSWRRDCARVSGASRRTASASRTIR